jgi:hypothetical protein
VVDLVQIYNRALQAVGSRTNVTQLEITNSSSNEAIQLNLAYETTRDELLRIAPWGFAKNFKILTRITSAPGTPENPTSSFLTWQKGLPAPPWAYEYQYPTDCLRALWIVPQFTAGFGSGVPITTAVTGGIPSFWNGPPVKFQMGVDQFFCATAVAIAAAGLGYAVGDVITLTAPANGLGAPAQILVNTIGGGGAIATASLITSIFEEVLAGSYFSIPTNPIAQGSTTGVGTGATFNLTFASSPTQFDQRVILTNQEQAILAYVRRVTDPNVFDEDFGEAVVQALGAVVCPNINGDKALIQLALQRANAKVIEARKNDANEGLTINDVTPGWIRARGIAYPSWEHSPNAQFDWGPMFTLYG